MSVITTGNVSDVLNKELSKKTPEEKAVIAVEIEKKRTPNPLEKRRTPRSPNELAGKDQAAFEAIQAGIPQEEQEAAAKRVQEKTARKRPESTGEKVNGFLRSFPAQSVLRYGQMGGKASGIELNTLVNPPRVGFAISDPKTQKTTKYSYPANKEVIQELSQDPDDPETSDESLGRKKFNYLLGLAGRGEKGIGERTKKEEFDTFVDTSKLEM